MIDEKKLVEDLEKTITFRMESYGEDREGMCFHWKSVKNMITQQPKIGEWIPCSERLPEIMKPVLVCDKQGNVCIRAITCKLGGIEYWSRDKYDVIAWQPLPDAYMEESEE